MGGEAVMRLFDGLGVCEFLVENYSPLHSLDREAILDEPGPVGAVFLISLA